MDCPAGFQRYSGTSTIPWWTPYQPGPTLLARVFQEANIQDVDPKRFLLSLAGTLEASLVNLAESRGWSVDLFDRFRRIYWTKEPGTLRLYHGIGDVLDGLEQRGVLLAIVTLKSRSLDVEGIRAGVSAELEDLGVADRFPVVIGFEDVSEPKPHPEGVLRALEQLGVPPERALMVGDNLVDIQAAKAAGCWACLAPGEFPTEQLEPDERTLTSWPKRQATYYALQGSLEQWCKAKR